MILSTFCENSAGLKIIYYINNIIDVLIIIPILVILLVSIDFAKNVMSGNIEYTKLGLKIAIRRICYGVALFFVPLIINIIFGFIGNAGVNSLSCWNKVTLSQIKTAEKKEIAEQEVIKAQEDAKRQAEKEARLAAQEAARNRSDLSETKPNNVDNNSSSSNAESNSSSEITSGGEAAIVSKAKNYAWGLGVTKKDRKEQSGDGTA